MDIEELLKENKYEEALALLENDNSLNSKLFKASILLNLGRNDEVISLLNGINTIESCVLISRAYSNLKQISKAIETLEKCTQRFPYSHSIYSELGKLYESQSDYETALRYINKALEIIPISSDYKFLKAKILYFQGNYEDSSFLLGEILRLNPKNLEARIIRASCYYNLGLRMDALAEINRALDQDNNNSLLHSLKGMIYYETGFYKLALAEYKITIRNGGNSEDLYMAALCSYLLNYYNDALVYIDNALTKKTEPKYYALKARIQKALGKLDEAKNLAKEVIAMDKSLTEIVRDLL
ncbi:lipopolysaccharide assembly protein LapB [Acidianus sp. RZ1]|uniref:tetratricopeptide repeat protein n=1 Tax=Acidianus sp. RZ1 TaxID=1540082 RepID=UPI0014924202|nr:CDC27 family protein [Acidianus sp. RZ1]NON63102.1 tetratricopeptide repeat protein [Acidianus sp. RZ1]